MIRIGIYNCCHCSCSKTSNKTANTQNPLRLVMTPTWYKLKKEKKRLNAHLLTKRMHRRGRTSRPTEHKSRGVGAIWNGHGPRPEDLTLEVSLASLGKKRKERIGPEGLIFLSLGKKRVTSNKLLLLTFWLSGIVAQLTRVLTSYLDVFCFFFVFVYFN